MRSTSPRRVEEVGHRELARLQGDPVGLPVLAGRVRDDVVARDVPASRTPDSSNVSRTAAQTSARAMSSSQPSRAAHSAGAGPAQATDAVEVARVDAAAGEDEHAAGELHRDLAAQQVDHRPVARTGRSSTTVAALRGSTGSRVPSAYSRAISTS